MLFSFPYTTAYGEHDTQVQELSVVEVLGGLRFRFRAPDVDHAQYYAIILDGAVADVVWAGTSIVEVTCVFDPSQSSHHYSICPIGASPSRSVDVSAQTDPFEDGLSDRIKISITPTIDLFDYATADQFSSWSLSGFRRFQNCSPHDRRKTWARLDVVLATSGGTRTLTLKNGGVSVASGTISTGAALPATITLSAVGGSGISGTVSLDSYTTDFAAGVLVARFPAEYRVHYRTTTFAAPDFPRSAELTIYDDGASSTFVATTGVLPAATYYVVAHQVDDDGNEGTNIDGGGTTVVISTVPAAPGTPEYTSGGADATVVSFAASATVGSTYRIYDSGETGLLDTGTVAATHAAGVGTLTQTLAAISGSFSGTRYVLIHAVSGGIEEYNNQLLKIVYASGVVISPAPPAPAVSGVITTSGRTMTVPVSIDTSEQAATAASVSLYAYDPDGAPDYGTPDVTVALSYTAGERVNTSVAYTAPGNAVVKFALRTHTAGGLSSGNTDTHGPIKLTTTAPASPTVTVGAGF